MGNSNEYLSNQLTFIQRIEDDHFGPVDIFRDDEGTFLMKSKCTHIGEDKRFFQFKRIVEWIREEGHPQVVPIIKAVTDSEKSICVQYEITTLYTQYFNYTLEDVIRKGRRLEQPQLWQILHQLIDLIVVLRQKKIGINLGLDNIFLTLKGQPVVYVHHLVSFEESICATNMGMGQLIARIILQLATGSIFTYVEEDEKEILGPLAFVCSRYRILGKTLRELLHREKMEQEVLDDIDQLLSDDKIRKSKEIKLNKFKYNLPDKKEDIERITTRVEERDSIASVSKVVQKKLTIPSPETTTKSMWSQSKELAQTPRIIQDSYKYEELIEEIDRKKIENLRKMEILRMRKQELTNRKQIDTHEKQNKNINIRLQSSGKKGSLVDKKSLKKEVKKKAGLIIR